MNQEFLKKAEELLPRLSRLTQRAEGSASLSTGESAVFDFGTHYTGYPRLQFSYEGAHPDAPALVRLRFCEREEELGEDTSSYRGWISRSWIQEEIFHLDVLPCEYRCRRRYAFRYLKVEAVDVSPKFRLKVGRVEAETVTSAPETLPPVGKSELEKQVDRVALKTLSECMQEVFEDGPKRDRRLWLGDLRLQAMANYVTFGHNDLVKRCLYLFAGTAGEDGRLAQSVYLAPEVAPEESSLYDYSLLFIPTLSDYLEATGDVETARELFPVAARQIKLARAQFDQDVIRDSDRLGWCFLDWSLALNKQAGAQAVYLYAEKALIRLCRALGEPLGDLAQDVEQKSRAALDAFFDKGKGLFVSGKQGQVSYATNVWYVLAGVLPREQSRALLQRLRESRETILPVTPYMMHHYVQALADCGLIGEARQVMLDYWGGMVRQGADTFFEMYDPADPDGSPYGGKAVNSYCHAWSCTPSYFIRKYFIQ